MGIYEEPAVQADIFREMINVNMCPWFRDCLQHTPILRVMPSCSNQKTPQMQFV